MKVVKYLVDFFLHRLGITFSHLFIIILALKLILQNFAFIFSSCCPNVFWLSASANRLEQDKQDKDASQNSRNSETCIHFEFFLLDRFTANLYLSLAYGMFLQNHHPCRLCHLCQQ